MVVTVTVAEVGGIGGNGSSGGDRLVVKCSDDW